MSNFFEGLGGFTHYVVYDMRRFSFRRRGVLGREQAALILFDT
jgi:hypothetical protein